MGKKNSFPFRKAARQQAARGVDPGAGAQRGLARFRARVKADLAKCDRTRFMTEERDAAGDALSRREQARRPGAEYLGYVAGIGEPDLTSTILIEILSYCDPELRNTIEAARATAANPDRIRFAVCLQDDDPDILAYLEALPGCKVRHFAKSEAPGTCAARYECQQLYGGEDFVFHVDAHMRFARYWDVAVIDQWRRCGDGKAVLSTWGVRLTAGMLSMPVGSDRFMADVRMDGHAILPYYFREGRWDLRMVYGGRACRGYMPEPGAFVCGHYVFGPGSMDRDVLVDRYMDFTGDEVPMAIRYYTHGYNVYHPCVVGIYHLRPEEYREAYGIGNRGVSGETVPVDGGMTRKQRQVRRVEKLLGLVDHPDVELGEFDLGRERTLSEFETFSGVSFGRAEILAFADGGRFGGEHSGRDLEPIDWVAHATAAHGSGRPGWLPPAVQTGEGTSAAMGVGFDRLALEALCEGHVAGETKWNDWDAWPFVGHDSSSSMAVYAGGGIFVRPGCKLSLAGQSRLIVREGARVFVLGNFSLWDRNWVCVKPGADLVLGSGYMNAGARIEVSLRVEMGDVAIGPDCYITDSDWHDIRDADGNVVNPPAPVVLGNHVWLGQDVTVLKGVEIGAESCVGAKSLVCKNIPARCVAAGNPARVIRTGISWGKNSSPVISKANGGVKGMRDEGHGQVAVQQFKSRLQADMARMGGVKYLEYLNTIDGPDLASAILVEIPAYCDPELMKTIESARAMAANPDRLHFAVCYQGDDETELAALRAVPNCRVKHIPKAEATCLCRARYECQKLLDGEDWVLHLDSHMRFAKYWDVALIAQWHACGDSRAIISEYCRDYSQWVDEPVGSDLFTRDVWTSGRFVNVNHFHYKTCKVSFTARHMFDGPLPRKAAFIGGHLVFGRPELDVEVPSDPDMYFNADEIAMSPRYWTHGFNIYQPGIRCVYHLYGRAAAAKKNGRELSRNVGDAALTGKELMRMEVILGVKDHGVDLGPFGLGTARSLQDYEAFAGVCFRDLSIRKFAYDGAYDVGHGPEELEPFDWIGFSRERGLDLGRESALECMVSEQVLEAFRHRCLERAVLPEVAVQRALEEWTGNAADRFRSRLRADMARMAGSEYLSYISGIACPDLSSTILIEIPAYDDPEVVNTVRAALAQAANPDRVRFAVCLQDDDPSRLEALRAVPNCRVRHYALKDAPGACAARSDCQAMYAGEDFVFHMDAHMRFARYWDVAAIDQWRLCGNEKAILGSYPKGIREPWLELPVDDDLFTEQAEMQGCSMAAFFFSGNRCELRCRPGRIFQSDRPVKGGFMSAGCSFRRGDVDVQVPVDPNMDFTGDESAMAARYWTNGYDFYHPAVRCVFHLYEREKIYTDKHIRPVSSPVGADGLTRAERQSRRLEKLLGTYDRPDVDLAGYGLGTERSLEEYQAFAGVDFRRLTIRKFAAHGMCGCEHTAADMEFFDWKAEYRKVYDRDVPDPGERLELNIPAAAKQAFEALCAEMHWHPQAALAEAVRRWVDSAKGESVYEGE